MLAGRDVRVADSDPDRLRGILSAAGITAEVQAVPATIEERMMVLARGTEAAAAP
jgi:ABC-2 type transport system ATP-binding protein/ribosome-dependent ATPase